MKQTKVKNGIFVVLCVLFTLLATVPFGAAIWFLAVYGNIGFDTILFTLFSELNGTSSELIFSYLLTGLLPALAAAALILFFLLYRKKSTAPSADQKKKIYPFSRGIAALISFFLCVTLLLTSASMVGIFRWLDGKLHPGTLYEEEYVDPADVTITFPEQKRNLIYIYLESMETTFLSKDIGGALPYNVIPELTTLAEENVNFSDNGGVGGFRQVQGANWTIAAMVAQTAGIPLCIPLQDPNNTPNTYGEYSLFLPGVTCLTDILHENGYYQALMVGSDASFGGRAKYYLQHGADAVYDYYTAKEDRLIGPDYHVWWGMEDQHLFEYAQQKLLETAKKDQPFSFTLLTVDTHHIGGYTCGLCGNDFEEKYENVYACSSRQVSEFVRWLSYQDFYENTTVIICGDHCSMDNGYMSRTVDGAYTRHVYNCILNAAAETENTKYRQYCAFDLFPTTLAALGCTVQGDRLGLGTNLFSGQETLLERRGYEEVDRMVRQTSNYYDNRFLYGSRSGSAE